MASASAPKRSPRLSVDQWTQAALDLLVSEGVSAVKISRLCEQLQVTKGSFYWHFNDIDGLMTAVAERWCGQQNDAARGLDLVESIPARQRLEQMSAILIEHRSWSVERAIRDWARTEPRVAEAVGVLDRRIMQMVQDALLEVGFDPIQARLRAGTLVYAGIGFVHARDSLPTPTPEEMHAIIALLTDP
ncbi:TetR/AcrR family transcriptional regulator [Rhodococcus sp. NPDC058514]|uniref:TetR/AcrR family transcriptional regulator n=1 Tax=unclassified Rhodococcus (in: high G+C Gram-positive bacteria) TaxID=192944 RepID=UPI0036498B2B